MDLFGDMVAILNSVVSNSYYGMLRGRLVCIRSLNIPYHLYETRLQGIVIVVFIFLDWAFVLMNKTTMISCKRIS